jgi:Spy/CpxP family protein refolding chaperone
MNRTGRRVLIGGSLAAAAFAATVAWPQPASQPADPAERGLSKWLGLSERQQAEVGSVDAEFEADTLRLRNELAQARSELAAQLERTASTDAEILAQVERVITAHDALERRVAQHLVKLRPHLTVAQQKRLFDLCAEGVREAGGRRWRGGRGPESRGPAWQSPQDSAGHDGVDKNGRGAGRRWRGGAATQGDRP